MISEVSVQGIGYRAYSFYHDDTIVYDANEVNGSAQVGLAVTLESALTVSLVGDGEQVEGKLIKVESDGICVVQNGGVMELPGGAGAALTVGTKVVGDLGADNAEGYIRSVNTEDTVSRGTILDATDPTAVSVRFD